jgi:outer membrane protein assembly factor BamB
MLKRVSEDLGGRGGVPDLLRAGKPRAILPAALALVGILVFTLWLTRQPPVPLARRIPGTDHAPGSEGGAAANAVLAGKVTQGQGKASDLPGSWPGFRGPARTGFAMAGAEPHPTDRSLARTWGPTGPRELWAIDVGEGYAGAAVANGRVYLVDYDRETKQDAVRCLSLADGKEIWRFAYPVAVKRNHGMSRTVPAVTDKYVVSMGPKCHVACLDAVTGELRWGMDLVREYGTTVPAWYAGQCPLIDNDRVILAPGGKDALLMAVELETGKVLWQTPNPKGWKMTHSSVVAMEFAGERMFVYCANLGVVGVSAKDGRLLWETTDSRKKTTACTLGRSGSCLPRSLAPPSRRPFIIRDTSTGSGRTASSFAWIPRGRSSGAVDRTTCLGSVRSSWRTGSFLRSTIPDG